MLNTKMKLAFGLSTAALLAIGASMTSFAAKGWVNEGDTWYYYDNSGDAVTDKWKSYNGNYFYLGDDGAMLTNELIDDDGNYYYVDANGAMVKNTWVAIAADEDEEQDVDYRWYYFGSTGKAYKDADKKSINGKKYGFDDEGKMLFGFVDDSRQILDEDVDEPVLSCTRYYGSNDDGAMYTGWLRYEDSLDSKDDYDYDYYWFYFKSGGEMVKNQRKKINGKWYNFDSDGVMLLAVDGQDASDTDVTSTYFYSTDLENGSLQKSAWIWASFDDGILNTDGDEHWFRTDSQGRVVAGTTKKVNSRYYVFDDNGVMQYGLVVMNEAKKAGNTINTAADGNGIENGIVDEDTCTADDIEALGSGQYLYYFSNDEVNDGSMKTGKNITISLADDDYTFGFNKTTGAAYNGIVDKKIYKNGILQKAGSDKYITVEYGDTTKVVNTSGTVMTKGCYKNSDDQWLAVDKDGNWAGTYDYKTASDAEENGTDEYALKYAV